ncbi:MAG TPA: arylsulfatase [Vicinamibacteria bacterium]|nr:arylsulfatase [Vicinamibacteria bacterium]
MAAAVHPPFLACAVLAGLAGIQAAGAQPRPVPAAARPNVILIITDDQGYGDIGAHGNPVIRTPHLDRLARQSVRLTDFHVDPTCSPTRAALLTGRYSTRTGVWHTILGRSLMAARERTVAELFARGGYRTAMAGKWHLGDNYPHRPHDRGFEEAFYHGGGVVGQVGDDMGNDLYDDTYLRNGVPEAVKGYATDVWFDDALRFVEKSRAQPFFLYLATNAAHWPYYVDQAYVDPYLEAGVPPTMARFYGMITNIDENVGRLRARLDELGLSENTVLIFMTDNGSGEGWSNWQKEPGRFEGFNAGMRAGKGSQYDGGHRVPFYVHWPTGGLVGDREVPLLSAHIDVLPTLAELCGLDLSGWPALDGASLVPVLRAAPGATATGALADRVLFVHSQRVDVPIKWRQSAVMTERWRLVNGVELYDIETDPGQKTDLAASHPAVVQRLRDAYEGWWTSLEPAFDDTARIAIGSEKENPVALTSHDWRTDDDRQSVWNANQVNSGHPGNGHWALDVVRGGQYEIELRRWPRPSHLGIDARRARLRVGEQELEKTLSPYDPSATFRVTLGPGPTTLQSWLTGRRGESRGAYFVYVRRVE